jgi:hypothetical protein
VGVLRSNLVPPEALSMYMELCTIKLNMQTCCLSQLEAATLRRIVVHGGQHAKSHEWMDALSAVSIEQSSAHARAEGGGYSSSEEEASRPVSAEDAVSMHSSEERSARWRGGWGGYSSSEGYVSAEDAMSMHSRDSAEADEDEDLTGRQQGQDGEKLGEWGQRGGAHFNPRQRVVLQLASRCSAVVDTMIASSRFSLEISKVLARVDEALAPTSFVRRSTAGPQDSATPPEFSQTVMSGSRHRWCVGKMVGFGGYGKVYAAWHLDADGRCVANVLLMCC